MKFYEQKGIFGASVCFEKVCSNFYHRHANNEKEFIDKLRHYLIFFVEICNKTESFEKYVFPTKLINLYISMNS